MDNEETKTLPLKKPIAYGEDKITELVFREPEAGDFRGLVLRTDKAVDMDTMLTLAGRTSGQPPSVIDRVKGKDLMKMLAIVGGFIGGGPETGK